ncbi:hypothetical protein AUK04_02170 [Candidatus Roizmanbacteria bacterium CG2_30_33_16]|uniref:F-type ATPase subunit b n=2 Tax=Candidatus Roizmaniibacteriota TaxID=1752723 RepID=A0A2M7LMP8_9BACT|nr:MAG: hypothetical protein AUK04_02170 [Candidatus Roizmanbacteria bacterium CG2_30_33_16]PIX69331.1 MAG: hypothetical protein COZ39_05415 [Candidatus Roizmanbacteria bacterium CG_4_10_14_3_um_filter_33_21]
MENLGIDAKLLIAQMINFVLFFLIVKKFIVKPFNRFVDDEKTKEKQTEAMRKTIEKQTETMQAHEKEFKQKMKKEMQTVLEKAKGDGLVIKEEMLVQTKKEMDVLKDKTQVQLLQEKTALEQEMKNKLAEMSMLIVNQSLKSVLDETTRKRITEKILNSKN